MKEGVVMTGLDALQSVQFVTRKGKRLVLLNAEDWEILIEWLETLEDVQIARQAFAELKAAKGNRRRAGWLEWKAVKDKLE
jgi:PHD/YefM family antitoxin component YafN of YafNO toxin-antitoxin module